MQQVRQLSSDVQYHTHSAVWLAVAQTDMTSDAHYALVADTQGGGNTPDGLGREHEQHVDAGGAL